MSSLIPNMPEAAIQRLPEDIVNTDILEMSFDQLDTARRALLVETQKPGPVDKDKLRRLMEITSRLRQLNAPSKAPKAAKKKASVDDL